MFSAADPDIGQPHRQPQTSGRPLATVIRAAIDGDAELRRLQGELKSWLMRGLDAFDIDGRGIAARRLRKLAPGLPRLIRPAGRTVEKVAAAYATDPRTAHLQDAWAAIWARRIEGRLALLLAGVFDELRRGEITATGRLAANPLAPIAVPTELWDAPATALDTLTGDILVGAPCAFVDVMVSPPPSSPRGISRSKLDGFTRAFGSALAGMDRHFTMAELVDAVRQELGEVSEREVAGAVRRASPRVWAGSRRRATALAPTRDELALAARQAAETCA